MNKKKYEELMNWLQDDEFTKDSVHKLALELRLDIAYQLTRIADGLEAVTDYNVVDGAKFLSVNGGTQ